MSNGQEKEIATDEEHACGKNTFFEIMCMQLTLFLE